MQDTTNLNIYPYAGISRYKKSKKMESKIYSYACKNTIRLLRFAKVEIDCSFQGLGIQYIVCGNIEYLANEKKLEASSGDYIIGNACTTSSAKIRNNKLAEIICIDISLDTICEISELYGIHCADFRNYLMTDQLMVNRYSANNSELGHLLNSVYHHIKSGRPEKKWFNRELFYSLGKTIISEQQEFFQQLNKIKLRSTVARYEVFRSLLKAKYFIDKEFLKTPDLDELCNSAGISRFYFCRLFKLVWGISPYQYMKQKKLELARKEIVSGKSIAEVGFIVGFSDAAAFSKSFRQFYGYNPGNLKKMKGISEFTLG
jgi:AraC-like DNA-binding protein